MTNSQNTSSAVMQQRIEPNDSLDDFPTPPWATRALCERFVSLKYNLPKISVREPAAGRGHMSSTLAEYFGSVEASDIFDYGVGLPVQDYLADEKPGMVDYTITNPPFRLAEDFIMRALETSRLGVWMLVRLTFLEGIGRYERLFSKFPPARVLQFTERVVMHKGKLSAKGSTATAYCWINWGINVDQNNPYMSGTWFDWIAPCRKKLERVSDYD